MDIFRKHEATDAFIDILCLIKNITTRGARKNKLTMVSVLTTALYFLAYNPNPISTMSNNIVLKNNGL